MNNMAWSTILIGTAFAAVALGIQSTSADPTNDDPIVLGPPVKIESGPAAAAGRLGMAEYYCHWTRYHAAIMILFTDAAIDLNETVNAMRDIAPEGELESMVVEFTESRWEELGAKLGSITLANGLDSGVDWMIFGRSAGIQLLQYVLMENNNWPMFGTRIADQAVSMAQHGHDLRWIEFSRNLGESLGRGTPEQWSQWGRQLALQARALAIEPKIDWNQFASNVATQAKLLSKSMSPVNSGQ